MACTSAEFDHPPKLFKPELFEMTPDVPPEYKLPDLRFAEYTEEEHATLLAEVQRRARERAYRPSYAPEEVEMLAKGSRWLEEYDRNNGVAVGVYFGKPKNIPTDDDQEFESLFQQVPDMMNAHMPMSEDTRLLKWLTWAGLGDAQAQELIELAEVSYQPTFRAKCRAIKEMGIETEEGVKVSECIAYAYENTFEEAL